MRRRTIEEVRQILADSDCKLLSTEYVNNKTPLDYICYCGNEGRTALRHFQKGSRCRRCNSEHVGKNNRLSYEDVKKEFEGAGYKLITTTYENLLQELEVECFRGHKYRVRLANFRRKSERCGDCKFEEVKAEFAARGYELLESEFKGVNYPMKAICKCKRSIEITYDQFSQGIPNCSYCGNWTNWTLESAKELFREGGCKLLATEFKTVNTPMLYRCECGNISRIRLSRFRDDGRCMECKGKRIRVTRRENRADREKIFNSDEPPVLIDEMRGEHSDIESL